MTGRNLAIVSTMAESPWGGSEELWAEFASSALRRGDRVSALLPFWPDQAPKVQSLIKLGLQVFQWTERGTLPDSNAARGLSPFYPYECLEKIRPELTLVSHGGLQDIVYGHITLALTLFNLKLPYVVLIQCNTDYVNFPSDEQRRLIAAYLQGAVKVCFVSSHNQELAERLLAVSLPNAEVVENPVNLQVVECLPWPSSPEVHFATIARLDASAKGYDVLLKTLSANQWKDRPWTLDIYGRGVHQGYIQQLIQLYSLAERVRLCGWVEDIAEVWGRHHMLLLSSRYEGTPLVLLEAMACGRPAVVTDVGGNAEWVEDGSTGYIAKAPTPKLFGEALERAWAERAVWKELGEAAFQSFSGKHPKNSGEKLYQKLCKAPSLALNPTEKSEAHLPQVAVIITCYNYADFLEKAALSVLQQTYKNVELIIVDDGSTDHSLRVAQSLVERFRQRQIRIIEQSNSGQPAYARNRGIKEATSDLILCLDADDTLAPTMLERCVSALESHPEAAVAYTDAVFVAQNGEKWIQHSGRLDVTLLRDTNQLFYCSLYKRRVFDSLGGYKTNVPGFEDWDFWIGAAKLGFQAVKVPEPLFIYRVNDTGMLASTKDKEYHLRANLILNHPEVFSPSQHAQALTYVQLQRMGM